MTRAEDYAKRTVVTEDLTPHSYVHTQLLGSRDALEKTWPVKLFICGGAKKKKKK